MKRTEKTRTELLAELDALRQRVAQLEQAERQQGEHALQESERRFRKVYENAPFGMVICELIQDTHGNATDFIHLQANPATVTQTGFQRTDIVGKRVSEMVGPEVVASVLPIYEKVVATQIPAHYEQYFAIYDRTIEVTAFHLAENLFMVIFIDISDRKRAEQELHDLNVELEHRVQQRTAQLTTVNNELKEFAYIVSHDLKAPLRAIARLSSWVSEDYGEILDEQGKGYLTLMKERVQHLDALINGILEYSRIGRVEQQREAIEITPLLEQVLTSLSFPQTFEFHIDQMPSVLHASRVRMTQIFQNLIGNAVKYMDKPNGVITITCQDRKNEWLFGIQDNGPGISPKFHQTIFTIFQTLQSETNPESTGLGLTIVKKIVDMYGGNIWVESEDGGGATFYFTLPKYAP